MSKKYAYSKTCLSHNRKRVRSGVEKDVLVISEEEISKDTELYLGRDENKIKKRQRRSGSVKSQWSKEADGETKTPEATYEDFSTSKSAEEPDAWATSNHDYAKASAETKTPEATTKDDSTSISAEPAKSVNCEDEIPILQVSL